MWINGKEKILEATISIRDLLRGYMLNLNVVVIHREKTP